MAKVELLQRAWFAGMKRDYPRDMLPANSVWNLVDGIPQYDAGVRQRGGWTQHSQSLSAVSTSSSTYVTGGIYATFSISGVATSRNLAVDEDGRLFNVTTAASAASIGTAVTIEQNPVFHGGVALSGSSELTGLVIIPDGTGAAVPKVYNGTSLTGMSGTPPKARYATVYKDYTVLANGTVSSTLYPNRIWFSAEGDPDNTWDTTDSWIDFSLPVKGLGPTRNSMLVFADTQVSRVRGSIPPPDEDMVVDDPIFQVGLYDAMSIASHKDTLIWAAPEGVFRSDGVVLDDLTKRGGMLRYWLDLTSAATSTWTFAGGTLRDIYFLCVMDGTTFKDCFMIDLATLAWSRLSNIDATSFWDGQNSTADELYWGRRGDEIVCRLSTIFDVGDETYKLDGDGDATHMVLETPFYTLGRPGLKRAKRGFIGYQLSDYDADNPLMTVEWTTTVNDTSYETAATLAETSDYERVSFPINRQVHGVGFRLSREDNTVDTGAGDLLIHDLGIDSHPQEQSRRKSS